MSRLVPMVVAILLLAAYGIAEGLWTDRWGLSHKLDEAVARLSSIPRTVGAWEGVDRQLDQRQVDKAEMAGYLSRQYLNRTTGASISMLLVCGRPGPTALHSPDICYQATGYQMAASERHSLQSDALPRQADFWVGRFDRTGAVPDPLRIFWSWSADGNWLAADNPRFSLASAGALYKLYVVRQLPRLDEPLADDPGLQFLQVFLPEVNRCLFQ
jgi:hypothetical protein